MADPAALTARARPEARPETCAANPHSELGIYQEDTDRCCARVRREHLQFTARKEDPGKTANRRKVAARIRNGREVLIEPVLSIGIAEAVEKSHLRASHLLHSRLHELHLALGLL